MDMASGGAPPAVVCTVERSRSGGSLQLRGRIDARASLSGTYRFELSKTGAAGGSRINQGGAFAARPGAPAVAGAATVDFAPGTRVRAVLSGTAFGQPFSCQFEETSHD